ncbi:hypothetical protein PSAC2689_10381 [Paraburkholderia sacchari]
MSAPVRVSGGADWPGVAEAVAGAMLGTGSDDSDAFLPDGFADDAAPTPLGDAEAFEYGDDLPGGDAFDIAGIPSMARPIHGSKAGRT